MRLKQVGYIALTVVVLLALFVIPWVFIVGVAAVSDRLLPWLYTASWVSIVISILILAPLAILQRTRMAASIGLFAVSYVFGATTWVLGLLFTWGLWGIIGVVVGIGLLGIGVVLTGMLATLFNGVWDALGILVLGTFLTYLWRFIAISLYESAEMASVEDAWVVDE